MERPKWVRNAARVVGALAIGLLAPTADGRDQVWADPQVIERGNPDRAEVALTFDCGGPWVNSDYLSAILDALDEYGITTTFYHSGAFVDGYAEKYPDILERLKRHEAGNHGYYHLNHTQISEGEQRSELRRTGQSLEANGFSKTDQMRPPFGARNGYTNRIAEEEGYPLIIMWSADSGDWIAAKSADAVKATVLANVYNGSIMVFHCNSPQTAQVLPSILWHFREWGIKAVSVSRVIS